MLDVGLLKKVCNTVFLYHRKSRCEILIGGDDISNAGRHYPWRLLFKVCSIRARFRFALIGGNLAAHSTGRHRWIWGGIQIPETLLQALLPFPAPPLERPGELARRLFGLRSLQRLDVVQGEPPFLDLNKCSQGDLVTIRNKSQPVVGVGLETSDLKIASLACQLLSLDTSL